MESNTDELRKFLENKISNLKKELEYYEYLLSLLESGFSPVKGSKGSIDYIKSRKGEIIAEVYYTPPLMKIIVRRKLTLSKAYINALSKILEDSKNNDKIDYNIVFDKDDLKEISINNVNDDLCYNKIKIALQTILERAS
ncbi:MULTISPECIES: hypothetical protein [Acidianus]|jgi:hypothetical protein|uniref:Uncharacterized protein n=3 Tax=Acidianus TaxID=12914 RepID=A0A650CYB2_ACIAM|nr:MULTISPECIES: hypothetical protein [Acidianus]MDT7900448.1 hypothetical protein [Acidianus sp.]AEE93768.1 conserved hypothetical protein [Acidianus hospitalis W1]MQL54879.1 hypothetical protein [Acidianus ambivalens]MUM64395.1 hypothetical protein [Acidianus infernus]QGR22665.1 hypothetical protein D1866_12305 [Acidianus ambivalens]